MLLLKFCEIVEERHSEVLTGYTEPAERENGTGKAERTGDLYSWVIYISTGPSG